MNSLMRRTCCINWSRNSPTPRNTEKTLLFPLINYPMPIWLLSDVSPSSLSKKQQMNSIFPVIVLLHMAHAKKVSASLSFYVSNTQMFLQMDSVSSEFLWNPFSLHPRTGKKVEGVKSKISLISTWELYTFWLSKHMNSLFHCCCFQ